MCRNQRIYGLSLIVLDCFLLRQNMLLVVLRAILVRFQFVLSSLVQLLQLLLVLLDRFGLLVDLTLEHPCDLEHILVVQGDALGSLVDIPLQIEKTESSLLKKRVQVGNVIGLALLLLVYVLICHINSNSFLYYLIKNT